MAHTQQRSQGKEAADFECERAAHRAIAGCQPRGWEPSVGLEAVNDTDDIPEQDKAASSRERVSLQISTSATYIRQAVMRQARRMSARVRMPAAARTKGS